LAAFEQNVEKAAWRLAFDSGGVQPLGHSEQVALVNLASRLAAARLPLIDQ